jgi:predicted nucleic acid-binding protein
VSFILDASMTMAWCFPDEATTSTRALLRRLRRATAHVPAIWTLEVTNILLLAERRQRITTNQTSRFVRLLQSLPITVDPDSLTKAAGPVLTLGRAHNLSSYDAAYLELAIRLGFPLATLDMRLRHAASQASVPLL